MNVNCLLIARLVLAGLAHVRAARFLAMIRIGRLGSSSHQEQSPKRRALGRVSHGHLRVIWADAHGQRLRLGL